MNASLEKVKTNFQENKKIYIGVGIGLAVAAVGVLIFKSREK